MVLKSLDRVVISACISLVIGCGFVAPSSLAASQLPKEADTDKKLDQKELVKLTSEAANWTPIMVKPYVVPQLFKGSEQQWHVIYDLLLTNFNSHPSTLKEIQIMGRKSASEEWKLVKTLSGTELSTNLTRIAGAKDTPLTLEPAKVGVVWVNISWDKESDAPNELTHRIVFDSKTQLGDDHKYDYVCAELKIDKRPPVVISPPLKGSKWLVAGGYVGKLGHRTALFPLDNDLHSAQPYAIDWERLDDKNLSSSDITKNESNRSYGEPVYAVADGTVLGVNNRFNDQPPQKPEGGDRILWPAGNSLVLDIGNGYYVMYAHMRRDSIKFKPGDKVKRGEQIGNVGSTGNSYGAHLHMHVTSNPGLLSADGVPYLLDKFEVIGEMKDLDKYDANEAAGKPHEVIESKFNGSHQNELPREGVLLKL